MTLRLADAPDLADGRAHDLGRIAPFAPAITLDVRGLADRVAEAGAALGLDVSGPAAASLLLRRVATHELTHLVDRGERWSRGREWRDLSGWSPLSYYPTPAPRGASGDFASPWGAHSPAEDLATFAELYFVPPPMGPYDAEIAPRCRFPGKSAFFARHVGDHPDPTPGVRCSGPEDVGLATTNVGEIDILWASPSLARVAAAGGHLLVALEMLDGPTPRRETFGLVADPGKVREGSPEFALLGMTGGFFGKVVRAPYDSTRFRYVEGESRDLLRFRLRLTDAEKARFLARLDDLSLHWRRPYLFFEQNCSALVIELANAIEARPFRPPAVVPPDLVLAELARRGRITPVPPDPERDLSAATRARMIASARGSDHVCGMDARGMYATDPRTRDATYAALADRALATRSATCWTELATALSRTRPLEAVTARAKADEQPGRAAALAAVRAAVPLEERSAVESDTAAVIRAQYGGTSAAGATLHTPYVPVTAGVAADVGEEAVPLVYLRREAIDLVRGEPRLFGPARGVDLRAFDALVGVSWAERPTFSITEQLLVGAYHPQNVVGRVEGGARLDLAWARLDTGPQRAWVRWAEADAGATLVRSDRGRSYLDVWAGGAAWTALDWASGSIAGRTWGVAPVRMEGVLNRDGTHGVGLDGAVALLPAIGSEGAFALSAEATGSAWVYLGEAGRSGAKLVLDGRVPWSLVGDLDVPPARAGLGVRFERW